jgi:hypothetical protein
MFRGRPIKDCAARTIRALCTWLMVGLAAGHCANAQVPIDQIVELVNGDIITRSDLLWSIALSPDAPSPEHQISSDILKQKLDYMIDQKLIEQEAARMPAAEISQDEINKARNELIASFGSAEVFRRRVESVGLTQQRIDRLLRERILIDKYIDFRFRSFVFVTDQEVQQYYESRLVPELRRRNAVPPPLSDSRVRDQIVAILKQQKVNDELDQFLKDLRARADIVQLAGL